MSLSSLSNRMSWFTVSKATLRSSNTLSVTCWEFMFSRTSFITFSKAVSVLWCWRCDDWSLGYNELIVMWLCIRWKMASSVSWEIYCKLLKGRQFFSDNSSPSFLSNGRTSAHFHWTANSPVCSDNFIILVITGSKTLMQLITSVVCIGSSTSKHDFLVVVSISFQTSYWLSISNLPIDGTSQTCLLAMQRGGVETMLLSLVCMVSIFWTSR